MARLPVQKSMVKGSILGQQYIFILALQTFPKEPVSPSCFQMTFSNPRHFTYIHVVDDWFLLGRNLLHALKYYSFIPVNTACFLCPFNLCHMCDFLWCYTFTCTCNTQNQWKNIFSLPLLTTGALHLQRLMVGKHTNEISVCHNPEDKMPRDIKLAFLVCQVPWAVLHNHHFL